MVLRTLCKLFLYVWFARRRGNVAGAGNADDFCRILPCVPSGSCRAVYQCHGYFYLDASTIIHSLFGLKKGVAWASNWNIRADILMLLAILICGPTAFILNQSIDGLGLMLQNFVAMSLSTDAIGRSGFPQMWTVFYFSWWVVYAIPFGLFIARISKGRTIRQLIVCGTLAGSLGCMVFTWYWLISAYRCRQLMSSILFPYLTNKGEALSFLVYWSSYPQVRCFWLLLGL